MFKRIQYLIFITFLFTLLFACGGGGGGGGGGDGSSPSGGDITVSWEVNKETAVNRAGGGYIVYFSQSSGFNPGDTGVSSKSVPYVSGVASPTTTVITVPVSGVWYIRVVAMSQLNAPGSTSGSQSAASSQVSVSLL